MTDPSGPALIRARAAAERLGVHYRTLQRWSDSGDFPPPVRLGPRGDRFYRLSDIHDHLDRNGSKHA
jgi:predicted DNA-binding transcriptional regulator AlpA